MKILDLLEAEFQTRKQKIKSRNSFKYDRDSDNYAEKYSTNPKVGAYGRVHNVDDPHMVRKIPHESTKNDAYYEYIEYVVDNDLAQSNPYFPRVYDIQKIEDSNGKFKYKIKMERLVHLVDVDGEIILGFIERLFPDEMERFAWYNDDGKPMKYDIGKIASILSMLIGYVADGKIKSSDSYLNAACTTIHRLSREKMESMIDLHRGNIMVRMSPSPQLVLVDPLS